jgi:hypothetical protein
MHHFFVLGKSHSQRKLTRKSHVQEQGLMTGTSHLADLGKMTQEESESWPGMAFIEEGG